MGADAINADAEGEKIYEEKTLNFLAMLIDVLDL